MFIREIHLLTIGLHCIKHFFFCDKLIHFFSVYNFRLCKQNDKTVNRFSNM